MATKQAATAKVKASVQKPKRKRPPGKKPEVIVPAAAPRERPFRAAAKPDAFDERDRPFRPNVSVTPKTVFHPGLNGPQAHAEDSLHPRISAAA